MWLIHGHAIGDAVLRNVAAEAAPMNGLVGRLGGEEFGIIVEKDASDAMNAAESFGRAVRALKTPTHDALVEITCSLGLAE